MRTGFIGLGTMGMHMAFNLHKAGLLHSVWNRSPAKAQAIAETTGVQIAPSPAALVASCELIITCVSGDADILSIVKSVATDIKPKTIIVDTSTVSGDTARKASEILLKKDAYFLDCPVSGGVEGAKQGSLAMMIGGDKVAFEKIIPSLSAIAKNISYIGGSGSGQACKAVNQLMAAGINQAVTEALAFGQTMQLDMDKVIDIISTGAAGNWFLEHRGKTMLAEQYEHGFKIQLHYKDLNICQTMLKNACGAKLPLIEMTLVHYQNLIDKGLGNADISALFQLKREQLATAKD